MSAYTNRGGWPFARSLSVDTAGSISLNGVASSAQGAGKPLQLPAPSSWLRFAPTGNAIRVYFSQRDFDANAAAYMAVASGAVVEFPGELREVWLRAVGGVAVVELLGTSKTG
jgi:hypothetical protein